MGSPHLHQPPFPPFYEQQPSLHFGRADYDHSHKSFKGLSRPLPSDVEMELTNVLNSLNGTKESSKGAKNWFLQRSPFISALAEALRDGVFSLDDSERQLHIVYLANDILFESLQRRINSHELDNEALAFKPVLGPMLARIYNNPQNKEENQSRLQKILQFWGSKEVYDQDTIRALENEMMSGQPTNFAGPRRELLAADPSAGAVDEQVPPLPNLANQDKVVPPIPSADQFHIPGSMPVLSSVPQGNLRVAVHPITASTANAGGKLPPYPLFPPGLSPGACIHPPSNLQVDPEIGNYSDGGVEQKPGLNSLGRLGLGATDNPGEPWSNNKVVSVYPSGDGFEPWNLPLILVSEKTATFLSFGLRPFTTENGLIERTYNYTGTFISALGYAEGMNEKQLYH
ncbi:hypothetical protein KY289_007927 [Solanum tuberosum]|nr:hypothetical protein KY289_007927 [Solanum tuberosum]